MPTSAIRVSTGFLAGALALIAPRADALDRKLPAAVAGAMAQAASPEAIADYRRKLREYQEAHDAFEQQADAYWAAIASKRRQRFAKGRQHESTHPDDYVLSQPPVYTGP